MSCESHENVIEGGSAQANVDDLDSAVFESPEHLSKGVDSVDDRS
jgi:hypothetical protein